jgi:DtxR family transcriptional regulator, Mn-dependent transcriptional regulator
MLSEAVEDYLKAIYTIKDGTDAVSTSAIAQRLGVAPASVTQMLKKLADMKPRLVEYRRHHGVHLTAHGEKIALEVIRHHRLVELFLQEALGMSWDQVDQEAERLEHVVSENLADRMAEVLGHPQFDPHGDPIPSKTGDMPEGAALLNLVHLVPGQKGVVRRVCDDDPEVLRYVASLGIVPKAELLVTEKAPFDGPIHVEVALEDSRRVHALGQRVASQVFVSLSGDETSSPPA